MLCSWLRVKAISVTFLGSFLRSSRMANLVGLDRVEKKRRQVSLRLFFKGNHVSYEI